MIQYQKYSNDRCISIYLIAHYFKLSESFIGLYILYWESIQLIFSYDFLLYGFYNQKSQMFSF